MVCFSTKMNVSQKKKQKISYRSYKNFNETDYQQDLANVPFHVSQVFDSVDDSYWFCQELMLEIMNEHAPLKTRVIKHNQVPYMNSKLRKAINVKHMLSRKWKKCQTKSNWEAFRKQRNLVTTLRKTSLLQYMKDKCDMTTNGKDFWDAVKPMISDKYKGSNEITLLENSTIVNDGIQVANIMNDYYVNITKDIGSPDMLTDTMDIHDILLSHSSHESIKYIEENINNNTTFSFTEVPIDDVYNKLRRINVKKATGHDMIPPKLVKLGADALCKPLHYLVNYSIKTSSFPSELKYAEVTPVFKKNDRLNKENYRPVSILPCLSKLFESVGGYC